MDYEKLRLILGEDGFAELKAFSAATAPAPNTAPAWQEFGRGLLKSWTTWFAGALVVVGQNAPDIIAFIQANFGPNATKYAITAIAVIVFLLRLRTKESIQDKGTPPTKGTSP